MCIIAIKDKGIKMPSMTEFKIMWIQNPDGAGYMYSHNNRVHIVKGFLKFKEFEASIKELVSKMDCTMIPFIFHFRITTHGGTCKENCHPFTITDNKKLLRATQLTTKFGVVHNGILPIIGNNTDKSLSDTMLFIQNQLYPISQIASKKDWLNNKNTTILIESLIIGSRIAIMDYSGRIKTFGKGWINDADTGMIYSNDGFKDNKYDYSYKKYDWKKYNHKTKYYADDSIQVQWLESSDYIVEYDNKGTSSIIDNLDVEFLIEKTGRVIQYDFEKSVGYFVDAIAYDVRGMPILNFSKDKILHRIEVYNNDYGNNTDYLDWQDVYSWIR